MSERVYIFGRTVDFMDGFIMDVFDIEPHLEAYKVNDLIASRIETNRRYYQNVLIGTPDVIRQATDARILLVHATDGVVLDQGVGIIYTSNDPVVKHQSAITFDDLHEAVSFIQNTQRYRIAGEMGKFRFIPVICSSYNRATAQDCVSAGCDVWTQHNQNTASTNVYSQYLDNNNEAQRNYYA